MPILKAKNENGVWEEVAGVSGHKHSVSDITDLPSDVSADVEYLKEIVGSSSVDERIAAAVANKADINHTHSGIATYNTVDGYGEVDVFAADRGTNLIVELSSDTYSDFSNIVVTLSSNDSFAHVNATQSGQANGLIAVPDFKLSVTSSASGFDASKVKISCTYLVDIGYALDNYVLNVDDMLNGSIEIGGSSSLLPILVDKDLAILGAAADAKATGDAIKAVDDKIKNIGPTYTHPSTHPASMITGLANVAITGDYNDLTNKPDITGASIEVSDTYDANSSKAMSGKAVAQALETVATEPVNQIQSDWNQSDSSKVDYIKNKPTLANVAKTGNYNDLTNKPTIPAAYTHPINHPASMITGLSNVATSGDYNDLANKPTIPSIAGFATKDYVDEQIGSIDIDNIQLEQVQANWDETNTESPAYIQNKPDIPAEYVHPQTHQASMITGLANVATSGSYNDLTNKPTIPNIDGLATKDYVDEQIASVGGSGDGGGSFEQVQSDWDETDTTSPAYIKNKPVISGDGGDNVQADWEQIDDTQPDYIKNKPIQYVSTKEIDILPLTQLNNFVLDESYGVYGEQVLSSCGLTIGETYMVSWDGQTHTCVAQDGSALMSGVVLLGNAAGFGLSGNNEPFIVANMPGMGVQYFSLTDTEADIPHTIRIYQTEDGYWTLKDGYADWETLRNKPFGIGKNESISILPEARLTFSFDESLYGYIEQFVPTQEQLSVWKSDWENVNVMWDGTAYSCEPQNVQGVKAIGNADWIMGDVDSGMPFLMMMADEATFGEDICMIISVYDNYDELQSDNVTHTMSVTINRQEIKTLDPKYISNVPWDKIENKPFGKIPAGTVLIDENITINEFTFIQNIRKDCIVNGANYAVSILGMDFVGEGVHEEGNIFIDIRINSNNGVLIGDYYGYENVILFEGDIFTDYYGVTANLRITASEDIISKIDPIYLDGGGLPEVTTSNDGQVMTVVNGEWAAQTPASGLPDVTASDVGKFLRVDASGVWIAEIIPNAEEASF